MNFDRLRFVAERAEVGEEREALFAVTIPEERGSFRRFCELIGPRAVTEFNYRISDAAEAPRLRRHRDGRPGRVGAARDANSRATAFAALDLTGDDLAKEHVRHMVGGRSALARDERLYRFVFPERPGALMRFLSSMPAGWNISLFHYRNQGADYGRILVGMQVPPQDEKALRRVPGNARLSLRRRDRQSGLPPVPATLSRALLRAEVVGRRQVRSSAAAGSPSPARAARPAAA